MYTSKYLTIFVLAGGVLHVSHQLFSCKDSWQEVSKTKFMSTNVMVWIWLLLTPFFNLTIVQCHGLDLNDIIVVSLSGIIEEQVYNQKVKKECLIDEQLFERGASKKKIWCSTISQIWNSMLRSELGLPPVTLDDCFKFLMDLTEKYTTLEWMKSCWQSWYKKRKCFMTFSKGTFG